MMPARTSQNTLQNDASKNRIHCKPSITKRVTSHACDVFIKKAPRTATQKGYAFKISHKGIVLPATAGRSLIWHTRGRYQSMASSLLHVLTWTKPTFRVRTHHMKLGIWFPLTSRLTYDDLGFWKLASWSWWQFHAKPTCLALFDRHGVSSPRSCHGHRRNMETPCNRFK